MKPFSSRRPSGSTRCPKMRIPSPRGSRARCRATRRIRAAAAVRAAARAVAAVAAGEEAAVAVAAADLTHRVGIGWRPELAAGIFAHLDEIDVVEVIADNYFKASRRELDALRGLAEQVPVYLHGVGLGLASSFPVEAAR